MNPRVPVEIDLILFLKIFDSLVVIIDIIELNRILIQLHVIWSRMIIFYHDPKKNNTYESW